MSVYELLADLAVGEEIVASEFIIGHRLKLGVSNASNTDDNGISTDALSTELAALETALMTLQFTQRRNAIDFLTIPFSPDPEVMLCMIDRIHSKYSNVDIGIDLSTDVLVTASESAQQIDEVLTVLDKMLEGRQKVYVLVATNVFTIAGASRILEWAAEKDTVVSVATETLKCHPRRPGLMTNGTRHLTGANEGQMDIKSVLETFKKAMDSCMKVERKFLDSDWTVKTGVQPTDVCFANVLAQAQVWIALVLILHLVTPLYAPFSSSRAILYFLRSGNTLSEYMWSRNLKRALRCLTTTPPHHATGPLSIRRYPNFYSIHSYSP